MAIKISILSSCSNIVLSAVCYLGYDKLLYAESVSAIGANQWLIIY